MTSTDDDCPISPGELPPGVYPVYDLAAVSPSSAALLLHRATIEAEAGVEPRQHVVITREVSTGDVTRSGPYPTGLEALKVAQRIIEQNLTFNARQQFTVTVAPVLPL